MKLEKEQPSIIIFLVALFRFSVNKIYLKKFCYFKNMRIYSMRK